MSQPDKLSRLKDASKHTEAVSTRAALQYIASCTRPDLCSATQLLASAVKEGDEKALIELAKITERARNTSTEGLKFVQLDENSLQYLLFTYASFGNASKGASQIGFVLCLAD